MNGQTIATMFALIRQVICGKPMTKEEKSRLTPDMLPSLYALSNAHDMAHIVAQGLSDLGMLGEDEISAKFQKKMMVAVYRYQKISYDFGQLCKTLEEARISFVPLKGSVLRQLYPDPWMRTSCDIDILVPREDLERAADFLVERLNYKKGNQNYHEYSLFSDSGIHLELHYDLIEEMRHPAFSRLLSRVWEHTELKNGSAYQYLFDDAFFYYYHLAHMVKHFEEGGCGVRPFLDLWILNHRMPFERSEREALIREGNLSVFEEAVKHLSDVWFLGADHDDLSRQIEGYILFGGAYGNLENKVSVQQNKKGGRLRYFWTKIFPPYRVLRLQYPVLQKHPYLTPVFVVVRCWRWLVHGSSKRTMKELNVNMHISKDRVDSTAELLKKLELQ